jgi:cyclophilin family peptidyl-prolyl cis-trans isomerase
MGIAGVLVVFGVTTGNFRGKNNSTQTTATTSVGDVSCPRADGSSPRKLIFDHAPGRCIDATRTYVAVIKTTAGTMTAELHPDRAFNAVNNFVFLARWHFYDGLPFHRVLKDTFAQTGDPVAPGITGPGYEFKDDGLPNDSTAYVPGALLYAHEAANQNGSQILLILGPGGATLNPTFPLFGQVVKGLAVLDKLNAGAGDTTSTPKIRYNIISIDVSEKTDSAK